MFHCGSAPSKGLDEGVDRQLMPGGPSPRAAARVTARWLVEARVQGSDSPSTCGARFSPPDEAAVPGASAWSANPVVLHFGSTPSKGLDDGVDRELMPAAPRRRRPGDGPLAGGGSAAPQHMASRFPALPLLLSLGGCWPLASAQRVPAEPAPDCMCSAVRDHACAAPLY